MTLDPRNSAHRLSSPIPHSLQYPFTTSSRGQIDRHEVIYEAKRIPKSWRLLFLQNDESLWGSPGESAQAKWLNTAQIKCSKPTWTEGTYLCGNHLQAVQTDVTEWGTLLHSGAHTSGTGSTVSWTGGQEPVVTDPLGSSGSAGGSTVPLSTGKL